MQLTRPIWVKYNEGTNNRHGLAIAVEQDNVIVRRARKDSADSRPYLTNSVFRIQEEKVLEFPAVSIPPRYEPLRHEGLV